MDFLNIIKKETIALYMFFHPQGFAVLSQDICDKPITEGFSFS